MPGGFVFYVILDAGLKAPIGARNIFFFSDQKTEGGSFSGQKLT